MRWDSSGKRYVSGEGLGLSNVLREETMRPVVRKKPAFLWLFHSASRRAQILGSQAPPEWGRRLSCPQSSFPRLMALSHRQQP